MSVGIYCYKDSLHDDEIVYIGKDSNIDKNERYRSHKAPSQYHSQPFNRVLQNNLDRYKYEVIKSWNYDDYSPNLSNALEILYIKKYNPKFNFTIGGDGVKGFKFSDEVKRKISKSHTKNFYRIINRGFQNGNRVYGIVFGRKVIKQSYSYEYLEWYLDELRKGKSKLEIENYPKIIKRGFKYGKQVYAIKFNGKVVKQSFYLDKLQKELDLLINEEY